MATTTADLHDQTATAAAKSSVTQVIRRPKALWGLVTKSVKSWTDDFAPSMGAAISYYTVFSIAPLLLIVIAIAGLFLGREAATGQIFAELQGLMGDEGAAAIQGMVKSASSEGKSTLATIIGVVTLLIGATTVFAELQTSLDRIWKTPAAARKEGLWNLLRARLLSFGMILAIGFLLLVSLAVSAGLAALGKWWSPVFGGWEWLLQAVNFVVSFVVVTILFAIIYKFLPRARIAWHDVWIGAGVTALLFTIGKFLIGLYIGKSSVASGFGAAGSLVVLLLWVYYSAQIFLLGAEFTWVYAREFGSRQGEAEAEATAAREGRDAKADGARSRIPGRRADMQADTDTVERSRARPAEESERRRPHYPRHVEASRRTRRGDLPLTPALLRTPRGAATRAATRTLDRHPKAELGLIAALGMLAAVIAFARGRLR